MDSEPISEQDYQVLTRLSTLRSLTVLLVDIAAIASLLFLAAWSKQPLVVVVVTILIARQQHALAILIHEGVHRRLFPSRRINDLTVRWLLAAALLVSFDGYRRTHLGHHAYTMTTDDPDIQFVSGFPMSVGKLLRSFAFDMAGIAYPLLLFHYWHQGRKEFDTIHKYMGTLVPPLVVSAMILAVFWWAGHTWCFFVCWLLPLFFVFPLFLHLRGICEHAGLAPHPDPMRCTWTVVNPMQTFFVAPHNINYHMEHHAYPAVPQFNLPKLHRILESKGTLPAENVHRSYGTVLRKLITA